MKLLTHSQAAASTEGVLALDNSADVLALCLDGVRRIDLHFPKFTDGRAFSQAVLLRRRLGFKGTLRATGDVLIDQLVQMQRCGFSEAVLREDQDPVRAEQLLRHFSDFYQGDLLQPRPRFARAA
ncbi:DUF934 domain-containing protein [Tepidicella baoligensis]|uniref:DUF934 domain-containing protein n=1 Tax=Tepidicella baoligensis TaxID=2707016 RepID=UPI0015DB864D|nr:DUF934 domain-containing protein [Tepidicella baoligensis]